MDLTRIVFIEAKDPNTAQYVQWDVTEDVAAQDAILLSADVHEVDCDDTVSATPTVSLLNPITESVGKVTAMVTGGEDGTVVLLRCAYTLSNGASRHATLGLPIRHT